VTLSVLVADDHAPVRAGVRRALERHGITVCAEAADARTAVQLALRLRPDACLLDVRMPGGGINAARAIADNLPDTAVVMLTISQDDEDLFGALSAGASGYLLKDIDPDRLPLALEGVLRGEAALPRTLVARLVEAYHPHARRHRLLGPARNTVELTHRECEVLALLREGRTTAEIAERLVVTPVTVRTHVAAILRKLGAENRDEALRIADGRR
jgi:DNA-binding NarL/FixJ family response regulator